MSVPAPRTCVARWYLALVRYSGLSGADGELSHTKAFGWAVLLSYQFGTALPAAVAIVLIVSSHGTKALLRWIDARGLTAAAVATDIRMTADVTQRLEDRRGWNSEREFQEA